MYIYNKRFIKMHTMCLQRIFEKCLQIVEKELKNNY